MSQQEEMKNLTLLGNKETPYIFEYSPQVLESFDNRHTDNDYFIKFNCPEFTSLCPITGQPDFANIYISYIPDQLCVESKSLKLYLFSYRNHGDFHENCINTIGKDLVELLNPRYLEVWGKFTPRGGISIDLIIIMAVQKLSMKRWQSNVSLITIFTQKILIIVNVKLKVLMQIMGFFFLVKHLSLGRKRGPPNRFSQRKLGLCQSSIGLV